VQVQRSRVLLEGHGFKLAFMQTGRSKPHSAVLALTLALGRVRSVLGPSAMSNRGAAYLAGIAFRYPPLVTSNRPSVGAAATRQ